MRISVNAPSYRRADDVKTLGYLPYCRIWVDCKEYDDYKANYPEAEIIACPDGVQGNLCRVRNFILREEFKRGMDVVLIIDDDFTCLRRFDYDGDENWGYVPHIVTEDEFMVFLEKYSIIAGDIGAKFWGVNCNCDQMAYRHNTPFSTRSYIGGPFQCFLKGNRCFYDEALPLKEDYDMTIQQLNMERVVLRVNAYHYICKQSEQKGGCAAYRNRQREQEQLEALRRKWGGQLLRSILATKGDPTRRKDWITIRL